MGFGEETVTRLDRFINLDDAARDKTIKVSAVAGLVWFVFAHIVFRFSDETAGYTTVIAVSCFYIAQVWHYCTVRSTPVRRAGGRFSVRQASVLVSVTACVLLVLYFIPASKVEANILDHRLLEATLGTPLLPQQANKLSKTLEVAANRGVVLPSPTLWKVRDAIKASVQSPDALPAMWDAANALNEYARLVELSPENVVRLHQAKLALEDCADRWSLPFGAGRVVPSEAEAAIADCTRGIQLAEGYNWGQIQGYQLRGMIEVAIHRYEEALADAEAADRLGSLQLSVIFYIKGMALVNRKNVVDRWNGVEFLLRCTRMDPASIVGPTYLYYGGVFSTVAKTYFDLREYDDSIENARNALKYVPLSNHLASSLYEIMIASYLQEKKSADALRTGVEFVQKIPGTESQHVLQILSVYRADPQKALSLIWGDSY